MVVCICHYMYIYISVSLTVAVCPSPLIEPKEVLSGMVEICHCCSITFAEYCVSCSSALDRCPVRDCWCGWVVCVWWILYPIYTGLMSYLRPE